MIISGPKFSSNKPILYALKRFYCRQGVTRFKPLEIPGLDHNPIDKKVYSRQERIRPRYLNMDGTEDWTNVWPAARSFNYSVVPLPVRQGHVKNALENKKITPEKYGNAELMKIPNFLHLTPVHIAKHCNAIKKYCTEWPESLNDIAAKHHFPLEITQTDYIHSAPSIRDPRARVVTLKFELKYLKLDERERFKFIHLVGPKRYDKQSDYVTIVADRCPSHRQNYDYLIYVLTALTKESKKFESWELEAGESDWLEFKWEQSKMKENFQTTLTKINSSIKDNDKDLEHTLQSAVEQLYNEGESVDILEKYKAGVLKLLNLGSNQCSETTI